MRDRDSTWFTTVSGETIGIVKKWDKYEGRWRFYIGTGFGFDQAMDEEKILASGGKVEPEHLQLFLKGDDDGQSESS